jgi:hypothetical protein
MKSWNCDGQRKNRKLMVFISGVHNVVSRQNYKFEELYVTRTKGGNEGLGGAEKGIQCDTEELERGGVEKSTSHHVAMSNQTLDTPAESGEFAAPKPKIPSERGVRLSEQWCGDYPKHVSDAIAVLPIETQQNLFRRPPVILSIIRPCPIAERTLRSCIERRVYTTVS